MVAGRQFAYALAAIGLWSTNALVARHVLADTPVALVQCLQFAGAAAVFAVFKRVGPAAERGRRLPPAALLVGLIGLVGTMVLQYLAFSAMPVIKANLIAYTWPLMVAAAVIAAGRSARPGLLGLLAMTGFAGAVLVIVGGNGLSLSGAGIDGIALALGSAACMASYTILIGRYAGSAGRLLLPSALAGLAGSLVWWISGGAQWHFGLSLLLGLYLGAGPMGLGYWFWSTAMGGDATGRIAILGYLTPVGSTVLLALAGEHLDPVAAIGAAIVICSCLGVGGERSIRALPHA